MDNWQIILRQAKKELLDEGTWVSFIEKRPYKVHSVNDFRIEIERLSGGENSILTPKIVEAAVEKLLTHGQLNRNEFMSSVAKECALIHLHPNVFWNAKADRIYWDSFSTKDESHIQKILEEASNDELNKILALVNHRLNQSVFKNNLLNVYQSKCVVSETDCIAVLQAAHISEHSISGNNDSTNGLLLRADLHILFDRGLLKIHPIDLTVHLSNSIKNSEYKQFEGKKILTRIDDKVPNTEFLKERWDIKEDN